MSEPSISSVAHTLHLLQIVAEHPDKGLSELSRLSGMNKSRTYRMLCTLAQFHFVRQNPDSGTYALGHQLLVLGQAARSQTSLIQVAEPLIEPLSSEFNENLQIRILEGDEVVQIWRRSSSQALQVRSAIGNRRPIGAGASGKILLAFAADEQRNKVLSRLSTAEASVLLAQIAAIREEHFYASRGELTAGACAFAVPIFTLNGACAGCLSLSAPQSRIDETQALRIRNRLKETGEAISAALGYEFSKY